MWVHARASGTFRQAEPLFSALFLRNKQGGFGPLTDAFVQMKAKLENLALVVLSKSAM